MLLSYYVSSTNIFIKQQVSLEIFVKLSQSFSVEFSHAVPRMYTLQMHADMSSKQIQENSAETIILSLDQNLYLCLHVFESHLAGILRECPCVDFRCYISTVQTGRFLSMTFQPSLPHIIQYLQSWLCVILLLCYIMLCGILC